ncbi:hypothetical protein TKK_0007370 [Trichogramma kaykai]
MDFYMEEGELAYGEDLFEQYFSEINYDEDVEQVIHKKKNSRKRSCCQDEEASASKQKKKEQKITDHNRSEYKRRVIESTLFEELAQDDEDEYENSDENVDEYESSDENVDKYNDDNNDNKSIIEAENKNDDKGSNSSEDNSNGFNMNSLRFRNPNGELWKSDKERDDFFNYVARKVEEDTSNANETDDESEDSDDSSSDDEIVQRAEDILKFFELHESDTLDDEDNGNVKNDPAEMERLQTIFESGETLSEEAKEEARKTRILVQSVYTVATILHKYPLEYVMKEEKKVEEIQKKCAEMRAALIANGYPEDKLPRTYTK